MKAQRKDHSDPITRQDVEKARKAEPQDLSAAASVRIEPGISKNWPYVTICGVLSNGNRRPFVDVRTDKEGNLTIIVGQEKYRKGHKADKEIEFSQELQLYEFTDNATFTAAFVDTAGRTIAPTKTYDIDD